MKEKTSKRLMMFEKVITVMDKHLKAWVGVPELSRTYDEFVKNYKKLSDLKLEEDTDLRPFVDMYMVKRKQLVISLAPLASVVSVFASDQKNTKLENRTKVRLEDIEKMKDKSLRMLSEEVLEVLTPKKISSGKKKKGSKLAEKSITEYGVTAEMTEELKTAKRDLQEAKKSMKDAEKFKKRCAGEIEQISKKNNKLLKTRLDRLVRLFMEKDKAFYKDYLVAREKKAASAKIMSPPTRQKTSSTGRPENVAGKPKSKVAREKATTSVGREPAASSRSASTGNSKSRTTSQNKPSVRKPSEGTKK